MFRELLEINIIKTKWALLELLHAAFSPKDGATNKSTSFEVAPLWDEVRNISDDVMQQETGGFKSLDANKAAEV